MTRPTVALGWMVALLLLTFWLGARGLDADSLWYDEYFSIYDAGGALFERRTPADIWQGVAERNPWHAPGFFIVLSRWGALVGWTPPALRALSLLTGLLAVAWMYRLGADLFSPRVGLVAAAILGTSAFYVHFLHELRMYAPLVLLAVATWWVYLRLLDDAQPSRGLWVGLFGGAVGLVYTHFFGALPLITIGLYHLLLAPKNRRWLHIAGVLALAGLMFLPWFGVLLTGVSETVSDADLQDKALSADAILLLLAHLFSSGNLLLLGVVGLLTLLAPWRDRSVRRVWFFMLSLLVLTLLVNAAVQVLHAGRVRYLLALLPLLALLAALGIAQVWRWRPLALTLLGLWLATGVLQSLSDDFTDTFDGSGYLFPMQTIARALAVHAERDDLLIGYLPSAGNPTASYNRMRAFYFHDLPIHSTFRRIDADSARTPRQQNQVRELARESGRVWLALMPNRDVTQGIGIRGGLARVYPLCEVVTDQPDIYLALYARLPVCCAGPDDDPVAQYGGVTLADLSVTAQDDNLMVNAMWWLAPDVPLHRYSVGLKLLDNAGDEVSGVDYGLDGRAFTCAPAELALDGVEAGIYTLAATVYAWETGDRLPGVLVESGEAGDLLPLTTVDVE